MNHVANFITIIRNGYMARLSEIKSCKNINKTIISIAHILKKNSFIKDFKVTGDKCLVMSIILNYAVREFKEKLPMLLGIKMCSKESFKIYRKVKQLKDSYSGNGIIILNTNKGVLDHKDAREKNVGGEPILEAW